MFFGNRSRSNSSSNLRGGARHPRSARKGAPMTSRARIDRLESRVLLAGDFASVLTRGADGADVARATAVDPQGNVVAAGSFNGSVDFAPGATNVLFDADDGNGYVAEYTPGGDFRWARRVGGAVNDITIDRLGNVYVTGSFGGTRDFDSTAGTLNLTSGGNDDVFVAKFDTSGNLQWAKRAGGALADGGLGIDVDYAGNAYVSGFFASTVDFDPNAGVVNRSAQAFTDGFIWKLSNAGNYSRVSVLAGNGSERVNDVAVDAVGNAYATGRFDKTADFDPGGGAVISFADATLGTNADGFVWGLNTNGSYRFVRRFGGELFDTGDAVDIDAVGHVYVTGRFTFSANFNPGGGGGTLNAYGNSGGDAFAARYDSVGVFQWARRIGGTTNDDWGHGIVVDGSRNVYVTGQFAGVANLADAPVFAGLVGSAGGTDAFLTKFDTNGTFVYGRKVGGTGNDVGRGVAVDGLRGNVFVAGEFRNDADFNPGLGTENRSSAGSSDLFLLRLTQPASPLLWAEQKPTDTSTDEGRFVATDSLGNVYIAGLLRGAGDLDPTGANDGFGPIGGGADVFVAKFAPDGTYLWSRVATHREEDFELGEESVGGLAVDFFGNVVVVGTFGTTAGKTLDFPNTTEDLQTDTSNTDAFIWKLNTNGGDVFARQFGNEETETATGVTLGNAGDVYVTGTFDFRVHWGPGANDEIDSEDLSQDVYVAKYDAAGNIQWATGAGGEEDDASTDIAFDFDADVVRVVGSFESPIFRVDTSYFSPNVSLAGAVSSFVARYTEDGLGDQVRRLGGAGTSQTRAVAIDVDSVGGVYVTGDFTGTTDLDPGAGVANRTAAGAAGTTDVFLVKLDAAGNYAWSSRLGGSNDDHAHGLDVLENNVFVAGEFSGSVDFDPRAGWAKTLTSAGLSNGFVWRLTRQGDFRSAHQITGPASDVAAGSGGVAHVVGNTYGGGDFDPGAGTTFPFEPAASQDSFLLKFKPEDTPSTPTIGGLAG
jgi:hypothetical protein